MSGDYSRIAFDPWLDDLGVLLQQGRPLTDRDWNDLVSQISRRIHAGALDTIGPAVVPVQTPGGLEIQWAGGSLTIGRGRLYVDGLLAENHGQAPDGGTLDWDPRLEELFGGEPLDYMEQPYYPDPPALPTGGPHLVYVDVWRREVTKYVRPGLIEPALGLDTTTRLQTVWQVKVLPDIGGNVACTTPLDQIPGWLPHHAPSAGRLTVTTVPVPGQPDPCQVPPGGGYKGLENQLYRVEVHEGGTPGAATFKWSRDNASVEAAVLEIPSLTQLVVDSVGRDQVLRFSDGDWIEITDDWLELHSQPGLLRRIAIGGGVDDATRTITLDEALPSGQFPTDGQDRPAADRHTRIRRWDQKHKVVDAAGAEIQDLDDSASDGSITIPTGGTQILLEHDIVVSFSLQPSGGEFHSGDHWVFAARAADASAEELDEAPPRGIHHHYAKLAIITAPDAETDCRVFWPPPPTQQPPVVGDQCACTVCVTPDAHASGALTVQMAIDQVVEHGGGTVCLDVGTYMLPDTLQVVGAASLRIAGQGMASRLLGTARVIRIDQSEGVTLESFTVDCRPTATAADAAVMLSGSKDVCFKHLSIGIENNNPAWSALALAGALVDVSVRDSAFAGAVGINSEQVTGGQTGLTDLRIENNAFDCQAVALQLSGITVHQFASHIRGNRITGCSAAGIRLAGATVPGYGVHVTENVITVAGTGIVSALDGVHVLQNEILHTADAAQARGRDGIQLMPGVAPEVSLEGIQVVGNHISGFNGAGIRVTAERVRGLLIKQNRIEQTTQGILLDKPEDLTELAIDDNQLSAISGPGIRGQGSLATLTATGNTIATNSHESAVLLMFKQGECVFSHNQCDRTGGADAADVMLAGGTLIVSANRVRAAVLSLDLQVQARRYTVLGNICSGQIRLNGAALPVPWAPLNVENVT